MTEQLMNGVDEPISEVIEIADRHDEGQQDVAGG